MSIVTKESNPELYNALFKEDILGAFLLVNDYRLLTNEELEDVKNAIKLLQQENQQLKKQLEEEKNIRDKAIEYINTWKCFECEKGTVRELSFESDKESLLQILQNKE